MLVPGFLPYAHPDSPFDWLSTFADPADATQPEIFPANDLPGVCLTPYLKRSPVAFLPTPRLFAPLSPSADQRHTRSRP